jgi:outer membrane immunogenic protein
MRRLGLVLIAAILGTGAHADGPPPAYRGYGAAPFNWTGFYVGAHTGFGWAKPDVVNPATGGPAAAPLPSPEGGIVGFQLGYNHQIGRVVLGAEADFTFSGIKGDVNCFSFGCAPNGLRLFGHPDQFATFTGRMGYSFDRFLPYIKGGLFWGHENFEQTGLAGTHCIPGCTGSNQNWGWTIGAGTEYALTRNWSLKLEYDYMTDFDKERTVVTNALGDQNIFDESRTIRVIKFGVNYRFN